MAFYADMSVWWRQGKGRGCDFFLEDEEIQELLLSSLPAEFEPYVLIGAYLEKDGSKYRQKFAEKPVNEFQNLRDQGAQQIFIKSERITGPIDYSNEDAVHKLLPTNGLAVILQDVAFEGGLRGGRLGVVNKIRNSKTGEVVTHKEYEAIFNAIRKAIKGIEK